MKLKKTKYSRILFDVKVCDLPLEAMLRIQVHVTDEKGVQQNMAWTDFPLFDHNK